MTPLQADGRERLSVDRSGVFFLDGHAYSCDCVRGVCGRVRRRFFRGYMHKNPRP
nr:MAG TPA: hypothetical protein [Caudoviricetes sp.]